MIRTCQQLIEQIDPVLLDIQLGGELSLLEQIEGMKNQAETSISEQQTHTIETINHLTQLVDQVRDPKTVNTDRIDALTLDVERQNKRFKGLQTKIEATQKAILQLEKEIAAVTSNRKNAITAQQLKIANTEAAIKMYHNLTGVHWEKKDLGYVLSEEIAKPIRYDSSVEATTQLWEMIDM